MDEKCIQCGNPAIAVFRFDEGCVVYPDIQLQPLCPQHIVKATPLGGMELVRDLRLPGSMGIPGWLNDI